MYVLTCNQVPILIVHSIQYSYFLLSYIVTIEMALECPFLS